MADREKVINALELAASLVWNSNEGQCEIMDSDDALTVAHAIRDALELLKEQETDQNKYEHHIDHTDCVWYKPEEGNECPVTCSQYRDGWNDAMDYIFKDGRGYRPYVRG